MKASILLSLSLFGGLTFAQSPAAISAMDFVKIKNGKRQEALFFYENNWKVYRDAALKKGFIKSYRILSVPGDAAGDFDLILVTEYNDMTQYKSAEERFQQIIKSMRPEWAEIDQRGEA